MKGHPHLDLDIELDSNPKGVILLLHLRTQSLSRWRAGYWLLKRCLLTGFPHQTAPPPQQGYQSLWTQGLVFLGWQVCWHLEAVAHSWSQEPSAAVLRNVLNELFQTTQAARPVLHARHKLAISPSQTPVKSRTGSRPCSKDLLFRKWWRETGGACKAWAGGIRAAQS